MNDIENKLKAEKENIKNLKVPEELETRLMNALVDKKMPTKHNVRWKFRVAALFLIFLLLAYNFDTMAFYGKKLVGYDKIMSGTLKQLNELGKGQIIGKSFRLKSGTLITLDGVMLDDNQLLAFYTVKFSNPNKKIDFLGTSYMKGITARHYMKNGQGELNNKKNEEKWIASFEPPKFFEKKLTWAFNVQEGKEVENGEINFKLDRELAMGHTLKRPVNKGIDVDETKINIDFITASPTTTVITGTIQNIVELAWGQVTGQRFMPSDLKIRLIANGKEIPQQGMEISTDIKGMKFNVNFDALPDDLEDLKLELVSFGADHDVNEEIIIKKGDTNISKRVFKQDIKINRVYESNSGTFVTITTEESVVLSKVNLIADGKEIELKETIEGSRNKNQSGAIGHTRTLHFNGTGDNLRLEIKRMKYIKNYNRVINIPVE